VQRTRKGGGEIVGLLKTGSAFYAPSAAVAQMCEAILKDKNLVVPCSVQLDGEYGQNDIFFGVPAQLGRKGMVRVIEYDLNDAERAALQESADHVRSNVEAYRALGL
jgi:malate dehydrogenase